MQIKSQLSWRQSLMASPGPNNIKGSALLFAKGICMGCADIIPGVSGGTIALISGIYENLLRAIQSINYEFARRLLRGRFKEALTVIHARFLFILLSGIGIAIISLSRVMNFFLINHPLPTWGFFFGLILASIFLLGHKIDKWNYSTVIFFSIGTGAAYWLMGVMPMTTTNALPFIFMSGMIAICAMILPGISGAFLLLILGKYTYITGILKQPFEIDNLLILLIFSSGCLVGILSFSRVLNYLIDRHHKTTLALLTGFMAGSLRKIWPWKETLETEIVNGKKFIISYRNIFPQHVDSNLLLPLLLALSGFILVILLHMASGSKKKYPHEKIF